MSPHEVLVQHMVDVQRANADFREASEGGLLHLLKKDRVTKHFATRSLVQKRTQHLQLEPCPTRKRRCLRKTDCRQVACHYLAGGVRLCRSLTILTGRFHVTQCAGCAILFNKDTFFPNIDVKSIYLHDTRRDLPDQVMEGEQGWVMQGVLSRASFRRPPVSGQVTCTVLSVHISNIYAKKKGIAKKLILTLRAIMISQEVDLVAGDFNGTAWRCRSRNNLSTIDEAFTDCALPTPRGPTLLWGPGSIRDNWADVCGFLKPPGSQRSWKVNKHGAFSIPRKTLGLDHDRHISHVLAKS